MKEALRHCGYPEWALKEGEERSKRQKLREELRKGKDQEIEKPKGYAVVPYVRGVTERLKRVFKKHGIILYPKAGYTIKNAVVRPKDPLDTGEQCGVVYQCSCEVCGEKYVGETGRSLGDRIMEHQKVCGKGGHVICPQPTPRNHRTQG